MGSSGSTEKSDGAAERGNQSASPKNADPSKQQSDSRRAASEPASAAPKPVAAACTSTPSGKRLQGSQSDPGPRRTELGVGPAVSDPVTSSPTTRQPHPPSQPRTGRPSSGRASSGAAGPSRAVDDEAFGTTFSSPVGSPAGALAASSPDRRRRQQPSPSPARQEQPADSSVSSLRSDGWKPESAESTRSENGAHDSDSDSDTPQRSAYDSRSMRLLGKRAHLAAACGHGTALQRQVYARKRKLLLASALM